MYKPKVSAYVIVKSVFDEDTNKFLYYEIRQIMFKNHRNEFIFPDYKPILNRGLSLDNYIIYLAEINGYDIRFISTPYCNKVRDIMYLSPVGAIYR